MKIRLLFCTSIRLLTLQLSWTFANLFPASNANGQEPAFERILTSSSDNINIQVLFRSLQEDATNQDVFIPPCNTLLSSLTRDELRTLATRIVSVIVSDPEAFEYTYLESVLVNPIEHGIQVHRVCAGCDDVLAQVTAGGNEAAVQVFETFCGPNHYGGRNATFSGLVMVPMMDENEKILEGTLKGVIEMHPTAIAKVPSIMWPIETDGGDGNITEDISQEFLTLLLDGIVAGTGQILVMPDYMGYAENANELYKGYTIKKAYQTSCVPIVLWAQQYIRNLTDCSTELSTSVAVKGYSEGGYTALVLADTLHRMGWNIIQVHAGGGPYNIIAASTKTFERISNGSYDMRFRHILALVGSSYSSTYADLPNYQLNQNMLTENIRPTLVDLIANNTPEPVVRESIPYEEQKDVLNLLFRGGYVDFVNASVQAGILDPCGNMSQEELVRRQVDLICESFQLNMVVATLQNVSFPVEVCHSPDDEVVPFESVPDLSENINLSFILAEGTHNDAGGQCVFGALLFYLSPSFQALTVEAIHTTAGCEASIGGGKGENPEEAPLTTNQPTRLVVSGTDSPAAPTESTAPTSSGAYCFRLCLIWTTTVTCSVVYLLFAL